MVNSEAYVGLAVTSHKDGKLCTAVFEGRRLMGLPCEVEEYGLDVLGNFETIASADGLEERKHNPLTE